MRAGGLSQDLKRFVAQPLAGNDFVIQSSDDNGKMFLYWLGRRLTPGVYQVLASTKWMLTRRRARRFAANSQAISAGSELAIISLLWPVPPPQFLRATRHLAWF